MANVLKWYWWRFNGYGYFWGMVGGIGSAMVVPDGLERRARPLRQPDLHRPRDPGPLDRWAACWARCSRAPEDEAVLKSFYRTVRPWGFWGPIREKVMREDPASCPNRDFARDSTNVAVGIVWQVSLAALPDLHRAARLARGRARSLAVTVATSVFLKFNWYDKLEKA